MKKTLLLVPPLAITLATTHLAQAETVHYQVGLGGSYSSLEGTSSSTKSYTAGLSGTYFLAPVETNGIVQNELTLVRRASFVTAGLSHFESKTDYSLDFGDGNIIAGEDKYDHRSGLIGGQYFVNENTFIGGSYTKTFASDTDGFVSIHGGYYYGETSAVSASLAQIIGESDSTRFSIDNKSLLTLNGTSSLSYGLGVGATIDDFEDSASVNFDTTYYFTNYTGLGISGAYHIDTSKFAYKLEFSHFFNNSIGLEAWVFEPDEDLDQYGISIVGRF